LVYARVRGKGLIVADSLARFFQNPEIKSLALFPDVNGAMREGNFNIVFIKRRLDPPQKFTPDLSLADRGSMRCSDAEGGSPFSVLLGIRRCSNR
jgi:hypothetical protein